MSMTLIDTMELQQMITSAVQAAVEKTKITNKYPALMTKSQMMEFLGIGATKAAELLNREDFPVIREFGHPKIPFNSLMIWIDEHTEWIRTNATEYPNRQGGIA